MNMYGDGQTTFELLEPILEYTPTHDIKLRGLTAWGDVAAEFLIYVDNEVVCGGRTSEAQRTIQLSFVDTPIMVAAGSQIIVSAQHFKSGLRTLKCNLLYRVV